MSTTVLIVEDDEATRARLAAAVSAEPELQVVGDAEDLREGKRLLSREVPDVLLVDLGLPDGSGLELIRDAGSISPRIQSMVITVLGDEESVLGAIEGGARGYLLKDTPPLEIGKAVLQLVAGGSPISPSIARHLLRRFHAPMAASNQPAPRLTEREQEVLNLVVKGFSYPEIARLLGIAVSTVTTHVRRTYRKLEVRSRGEAVYEALAQGLIQVAE